MTWPPAYLSGVDLGDEQPASLHAAQGISTGDLARVRQYLEENPPAINIRALQGFVQYMAAAEEIEFAGVRTASTFGDLGKINPSDPDPLVGPQLAGLANGEYVVSFGAALAEIGTAGTIGQIGLEIDGAAPVAPYVISVTEPVDDLVFYQSVSKVALLTLRNLPVGGHMVVMRYVNSALPSLPSLRASARWLTMLRVNNA